MNQKTLKNVIIGLLVVIIILLVLIYLYHSRNTQQKATIPYNAATNANTGTTSYPTIVRNAPPVILESPYLYDSGYWVSPDAWWMGPDAGNTYVRNNYKTNYNYYYNKHNGEGNTPVPPTTASHKIGTQPHPNSTPSATMGIQNILPTGTLVSPSQDSVFPLPTLAAPGGMISPDAVPINTVQSPAEMPQRQLPDLVRSDIPPAVIADSMAAQVDIQASQVIGMRGGNNHLEPAVPEVAPSII